MAKSIFNLFKKTSKESINLNDYLAGVGSLDSKFARDIFTKKKRTLHQEMSMCKEAYRENALVHSSVETMVDLIKGDKYKIETNNLVLKKYLEDRHLQESGFNEALDVAIREAVITGNGYIELLLDKEGNIIRYLPIYNSEDIYIDYDYSTNSVIRYIQKIYITNMTEYMKKKYSVTIKTPYGIETIFGKVIKKEYLVHFKLGNSPWGVYGRSDVASVLDDLRILSTIERSIAVISKYKAIPKKALMIEKRDGERPLTPGEVRKLASDIRNMADFESPILNRMLTSLDLSSSGGEINLTPYIDYLKRKITVSMAPEFLIHGQEVNRATSREQKQTYFLRIASKRQSFEPTINVLLRKDLAGNSNKDLLSAFVFKFGEFDIVLPEEQEKNIQDRFKAGIITLSEARAEMGLPELEGTDLFYFELNINNQELTNEKIKEPINKTE